MPQVQLIVEAGELKGRRFDIVDGASLTLGRSIQSDIQIPDQGISRAHCRIENLPEGVMLHDLNSSNGTLVNDEPITTQPLRDGDLIRIGDSMLRCALAGTSAPEEHETATGTAAGLGIDATVNFVRNPVSAAAEVLRQKYDVSQGPLKTVTGDSPELNKLRTRLNAICSLASRIYSESTIKRILRLASDTVLDLANADRGAVLLIDGNGEPKPIVSRHNDPTLANEEFRISYTVVNETIQTGDSVITADAASDDRFKEGQSIVMQNIQSVMSVPLMTQQKVIGAMYVDCTSGGTVFTEQDLAIMAAVGHQAAVAVERARLVADLELLFFGSMHAIVASIEAKDTYTKGHSERVTCFSLMIADEMGLSEEQRLIIELGGLMHDVGKIGVPEAVLCSKNRLSEEEFALIKEHPARGATIVQNMPEIDRIVSMRGIVEAVRHHHEKFDGSGYPDGLAGEGIPLPARILAVADTFDAITSNRTYRKGRDAEKAMEILRECAGTQVDSQALAAFEAVHLRGDTARPEEVAARMRLDPYLLKQSTAVAVAT